MYRKVVLKLVCYKETSVDFGPVYTGKPVNGELGHAFTAQKLEGTDRVATMLENHTFTHCIMVSPSWLALSGANLGLSGEEEPKYRSPFPQMIYARKFHGLLHFLVQS